jgi:hypothetical protein
MRRSVLRLTRTMRQSLAEGLHGHTADALVRLLPDDGLTTYCRSSPLASQTSQVALLQYVGLPVSKDRSSVRDKRSSRSRESECETQEEVGVELHDSDVVLD